MHKFGLSHRYFQFAYDYQMAIFQTKPPQRAMLPTAQILRPRPEQRFAATIQGRRPVR